ncbi:MAG: Ig-like domain-containing protein [Anaerolineae bacterium]|nr:Ig-like domain-containing protein [Anaerolineae bacterium]
MDAFDRLVLGVSAALVVALGVVLALGDNIGVPVLDYAPGDGQSPPSTAAVRVTFGERMDAASAEAHFAIAPPVAGGFRWARNTMTFAPDAPLAPGATYTVTLQAGAQSAAGRRTQEDVAWSFTPRAPRALYLALEEGHVARPLGSAHRRRRAARVVHGRVRPRQLRAQP